MVSKRVNFLPYISPLLHYNINIMRKIIWKRKKLFLEVYDLQNIRDKYLFILIFEINHGKFTMQGLLNLNYLRFCIVNTL